MKSNNIKIKGISLFVSVLLINFSASAQKVYPLYDSEIPNAKPTAIKESVSEKNGSITYSKISVPTITAYLPTLGNKQKAAVIVVPGGGYTGVAYTLTGVKIAKYFKQENVASFVLKYRLPNDEWMVDKKIGPLQDLQTAIIWVKAHALEFGIDTSKVGVVGCSAGGHLAATASTHFKTNFINNPEYINLRPAFSVLLYPVISFTDSLTHKGSRNALLGLTPDQNLIKEFSNEWNVTKETPPTFIVHAQDDQTAPVMASIYYYQALTKNGVPAEMHIYPHGGHGFGVNNKTTPDKWLERCKNWMISNQIIN